MIRQLKHKFVFMAMGLITLFLVILVTGMNILNYNAIIAEANDTLSLLSDNKGDFPPNAPRDKPGISPEFPYETRFFYVVLSDNGRIVEVDTSNIAAVDNPQAKTYALQVIEKGNSSGWVDDYRYSFVDEGRTNRITFIDCSRKLHSFRVFLESSILMSLLGLGAMYWVMMYYGERFIRPIAEGYEKQKRFISDASHEIKTPLTIINANIELLEMDLGENECLSDIQQQTQRLISLTEDLVSLARLEESTEYMEFKETDISAVVTETIQPFRPLATAQRKEIRAEIQPTLSARAYRPGIERLICLLMDNAIKYSPEGEAIRISLAKHGKSLHLEVYNKSSSPLSQEDLSHLFDRFYRSDSSRNSSSGGHGIGLSVASAIVSAHNGRISAWNNEEYSLNISVILPI